MKKALENSSEEAMLDNMLKSRDVTPGQISKSILGMSDLEEKLKYLVLRI